ncbi:M14 family zinc carboxypeptidase [Neptuniibacter sp. QD34_54]|uniref:M14 family zinc carboxypeptidase n=1 Tax=Neptuniibacter sp. QD34_54 TaxID=3398208 RepID=UPI0039F62670
MISSLTHGTNHPEEVTNVCKQVGKKLASVSVKECLSNPYLPPRFYSVQGRAILEAHFQASEENKDAPRVLFIGGIHGDEYSSVSVTFKWLNTLRKHHSGAYDWYFLPVVNPDGLLQRKSSRVNANKVDLNRNFTPAPEFPEPLAYWQKSAKKRLRYFPGHAPLSEPESRVIHNLIDEYKPTVIVSVHAPHGILDFDGGVQPPRKLGPLHLRQLGTYPGSLGNYGWFVKNIPVVTIELPYAGIMPPKKDIDKMWTDLVGWLKYKSKRNRSELAASESSK